VHAHHPCGGLNRRHFLASAAALPALAGQFVSAQEPKAAAKPAGTSFGELGVPGPYPGRVVEVRNPAMIRGGVKNQAAVRQALDLGMRTLTGADKSVEAWRRFFAPGDVVGIKVVPNGQPLAHTSFELLLEVIDGLKTAGVKTKDMVVFDRYKSEFLAAGYDKVVPDGITCGGLTSQDDGSQLLLKFGDNDPIAGYDPDEFMQMNLIHHDHDPKDDRALRSHLGLLVTRRVNKLVLLPVMKDHGSAGVTGALKNMSHGLVNNVARSHSTPSTNACNQFIPQSASHPIIRKKCVLQIMDAIRAVYQGGPFGRKDNLKWTWENNALLLATDPVAMDHVEWLAIDAKRKQKRLVPVGSLGQLGQHDPDHEEGFDIRQPQHIALAGNLGLGLFDLRSPRGRRFSIDHKVVTV
jgi:hypothetical protein